ncbi:MAG TPA: 50S ribosomal protein L13 [Candidatus Cloacimonadota bacterium]|jgi:large subunit ribosomal protein L13|nr:50S ribosomal protein L13 [Candidatus Cloacimonadales bacterium]HPY95929.1 50S ribosomal protein L13 [Candidatus Cloacimonadota bacterium]HQB40890.1 50S ribosomal protein L13 [Candidatus Cloacimonadota bacterium]
MKTFTPRPSEIDQQWYVIDATDKTLGRISTQVAAILRGKNKPYFTPNIDTGDYVVIINADKVAVTGSKALQKVYKSFSGYPGGLREVSFKRMVAKKPEEIIIHSVKGMLPKNVLGRQMIKKLKVYAGSEHPHTAQKPTTLS